MAQPTLNDLCELASRRADEMHGSRSFYFPMSDRMVGSELYQLANAAHWGHRRLHYTEVLPTFFTDEACLVLRQLPNAYWFWTILHDAAVRAKINPGDIDFRIGVEPVREAIASARAVVGRVFDLTKPVAALSHDELEARAAAGLVVTNIDAPRPEMIANPMFDTTPMW